MFDPNPDAESAAMKISGTGPVRPPDLRDRRRIKGAKGTDFAAQTDAAPPPAQTGETAGAGPVASVEAILALQQVPDATTGAKRAIAHGATLLDRLDDLRLALLVGRLGRAQIERLAEQLRARRETASDPSLVAVIEEIELRAAVELAKLDGAT